MKKIGWFDIYFRMRWSFEMIYGSKDETMQTNKYLIFWWTKLKKSNGLKLNVKGEMFNALVSNVILTASFFELCNYIIDSLPGFRAKLIRLEKPIYRHEFYFYL